MPSFLLSCDQPFVTAAVLTQLIQLRLTSGKPIVASAYARRSEFPLSLIDLVFQICCDSKEIAEPKRSFSRGHTMSSRLIFPPGRSTSTPLRITKSSINAPRTQTGIARCGKCRGTEFFVTLTFKSFRSRSQRERPTLLRRSLEMLRGEMAYPYTAFGSS